MRDPEFLYVWDRARFEHPRLEIIVHNLGGHQGTRHRRLEGIGWSADFTLQYNGPNPDTPFITRVDDKCPYTETQLFELVEEYRIAALRGIFNRWE